MVYHRTSIYHRAVRNGIYHITSIYHRAVRMVYHRTSIYHRAERMVYHRTSIYHRAVRMVCHSTSIYHRAEFRYTIEYTIEQASTIELYVWYPLQKKINGIPLEYHSEVPLKIPYTIYHWVPFIYH